MSKENNKNIDFYVSLVNKLTVTYIHSAYL